MAKTKTNNANNAIDAIIANIEKSLGFKGVIQKGYRPPKEDMISFGYTDVDDASNCAGVPRGRLIEIFGPESGGKSFLSLKLIASAQKQGIKCCLVDAEQAYDPDWAKKHGVDIDELFVMKEAMSAELILDHVDMICKSGGFGLVVLDSIAALIPQKELEGSIGDQDYALVARAMSKGCRKITQSCATGRATCVFINQIREKMNVTFGNPETTPGGRALKFYASQRILVVPGKRVKVMDGKKEKIVARKSSVTFVKNKTGAPWGNCEIEIIFFEEAMSPVVKLCNVAKDYKLIGQRDGTFQIKKDVIGEKKNLDTGMSTIVELADYIVKNNYATIMVDAVLSAIEEAGDRMDGTIKSLKEDPSLIVSPLAGKEVTVETVKHDAKLMEELRDAKEDKEEDLDNE
jgi:recombination protein RecA